MTVKVRIGSAYSAPWFEHRYRDGTYAALKPAMGQDALRLQRALLLERRASGSVFMVGVVAAVAVMAVVVTVLM